ncbi:hypothetical protein G9H62_03705 [Aquirufa ecclesiirivi]|uniref:energy transducer TonB n=1 Tax=Aquirufa ecclesiirivi TaxID=2715124 RepID=UPI0022A81E8F|nr:hypothetical protein [Aquirufa ecclesiirivi]MCZ2471935.1 hypothetical protein [Aquirufa ecclesiirivi]
MNSVLAQKELEKKNQLKALALTILINGGLLLIFWTLNIWSGDEVKMEIPAGGFEVNYGNTDEGGGNVQTHNQANDLPDEVESKQADKKVEPKKEIVKTTPTKESPLLSSTVKSTVKIADKPAEKVSVQPPKPVVEEQPKIDESALFKKKSSSNGTRGTSDAPGGNSNGNDKGKIGDKGQLDGDINNSAIYSGQKGKGGGSGGGIGGGNGVALNMTGWALASRPQVNDDSDESGIIRFSLKIDESGNIISLRIIENTLSASVAQKYKRAVEKLSFKPTSGGERPEVSTGTIVFKINSK